MIRRLSYPPVNTQPANVCSDGLPASWPRNGNELVKDPMKPYHDALASYSASYDVLPPQNPKLTLVERGLKRCSSCGAELPVGYFRLKGNGVRRSRCKECERPQSAKDRAVRRLRLYGADVGGFGPITPEDIRRLMQRQRYLCACGCGVSVRYEYHIDHIVALKKGGSHSLENFQILTPKCNLKKGAK